MKNWKDRRVVVTGARGFIGTRLFAHLKEEGADVRAAEGDLRGARAARSAARGAEVLFHLAAAPGGRAFVEKNPALVWSNAILDASVAAAAAAEGVKRLVFASSANVYPHSLMKEGAPLAENMAGPPYDPDGTFGWAKLSTERLLADYKRNGGPSFIACRLFSVYGEDAPPDNAVRIWTRAARSAAPRFELWGGGEQKRSWLHVDDAVSGLLRAADAPEKITALNLGGERAWSTAEVVALMVRLFGRPAKILRRPNVPAGAGHQVADISRARALGWRPAIPLEKGLLRA